MSAPSRRGRRRNKTASFGAKSFRPAAIEGLEERNLLSLLGQQLFPSDNPWNQKITNAPVAANSTAVINNVIALNGSDGLLHPDFSQDFGTNSPLYGIPYNVVHGNTQPKVHVVIDAYASESDLQDVPIPPNAVLEGDLQNGPTVGLANRGDSHLIVWDEDNNVAYELFHASRPSENADGQWHADGEAVWDMKVNTFRTIGWTSADAAGQAILPGLARPDEGLPVSQGGQGVINHALRFTLQNSAILDQFLYPASHVANPGNTNAAVQPPMGARFRLKSSVNISQLDPESKIIAQALKDYGLILADNGSSFFLGGTSASVDASNQITLTWNNDDLFDYVHGLRSLTFSDFEMVDQTPVVTGLSASGSTAGTTVTVVGQNFSGAAGRLQVLFGGTPATNVTVVDDSHVTATVPAGSGTVDVRIQSGVADPSDPSNVKSPIFGYGISAVSAGDRFTYQGPQDHPPVAVADRFATGENTTLTVPAASGVLTNDSDPDSDPLTARLVNGPSHGTLTLNADGSFTYNPATNFIGTDSFTYKANDGQLDSNVATVTIAVGPQVGDAGFETPTVGTGAFGDFQYDPTGTPWTYTGHAGVSGNGSGFTNGNPNAPEGTQVALLQMNGSISQVVAGWTAGTDQISFSAAQRANYQTSHQDFQVLVDGNVVGSFTPTGATYATDTTAPFSVTAGSHTIVFQGLDSAGGDNTAFLDDVQVLQAAPPPTGLIDGGFEAPSVGTGAFQYDPANTPWTYTGLAGVSNNGSGFTSGNPNAPEGTQVGYVQMTGSLSQVVTGWTAGTYQISFAAAQRANYQTSRQNFQVLVDGNVVGSFTPTGPNYAVYTTAPFSVTAGSHTIVFQGLDSAGGDNTVLLDNVQVVQAAPPPSGLADAGFEAPSVGTGAFGDFQYDPANTPWTYTGYAGVSGNGSGFTAGNLNAPEGTQVGFLQMTGAFSQVVTGLPAGTDQISFEAAQRANYQASRQDIRVLVDGNVIGTFTPTGTSYSQYTTSTFTVAAGSHTVVFQGLDSAGGDNTALIDSVQVIQATP